MKSISDLTIVVCSCDKYEDLWYPYFEIFKRNWSDCKYPIVLNTESKKYFHEGLNIKCPNNFFEEVSWSERMKNTLEHIETEYVLITCDDHFIISPVNTREFENAFSILKKNKRITTFSFVPHISPEEKTKWIGNFGLWKMNKSFRVNL